MVPQSSQSIRTLNQRILHDSYPIGRWTVRGEQSWKEGEEEEDDEPYLEGD
jgi:hypothetical protein